GGIVTMSRKAVAHTLTKQLGYCRIEQIAGTRVGPRAPHGCCPGIDGPCEFYRVARHLEWRHVLLEVPAQREILIDSTQELPLRLAIGLDAADAHLSRC